MRLLLIVASIAGAVLVASLIPGPYSSVTEAVAPNTPLLGSAHFNSASTAAMTVACHNCHSNQTHWPWYSRVAPLSWLIRRDVSQGRQFLNFSQWAAYGAAGQSQLSVLAAEQIKLGKMPPQRYLLLHPEARLTDQERSGLVQAFEQEAARLAVQSTHQ